MDDEVRRERARRLGKRSAVMQRLYWGLASAHVGPRRSTDLKGGATMRGRALLLSFIAAPLAFAPAGDRVYAFLPQTHRAAVYQESENQ